MAAQVLWLSLVWVEGCNHQGTVSGSGTTAAPAEAATLHEAKLALATADPWEPGPAKAWKACNLNIAAVEHRGVNGPNLAGFEFFRSHGISKERALIVGVRVQQGVLVGEILSSGGEKTLFHGDAWKGVQLRGRIRCPYKKSALKLNVEARIRDVIAGGDHAGSAGDARRYELEILWPPVGSSAQRWTSQYTSGYAVALEGVWDDATGEHRSSDDMLTLSSDATAVGKCYQHFRYRPWDTGEPASLKPMPELHAACVRMVRADYCGKGESATEEKTPIDVWDTAHVNEKDQDRPGHGFEAAWTSKGAVCLNHPRWPRLAAPCASALPSCDSPKQAKELARQKGLGKVLLFNASCKGHPCPDDPVRGPRSPE